MLSKAEIDAVTHFLSAEFVPENKSTHSDMYWLVSSDIKIYIESIGNNIFITTENSGASSLQFVMYKTAHSKENGILGCVADHIYEVMVRLDKSHKTLVSLHNGTKYEAMLRQQMKVTSQVTDLLHSPGSLQFRKNEVHVVFPGLKTSTKEQEVIGSVTFDLRRSDEDLVELLTKIIQKCNLKYLDYLVQERSRIDAILKEHGIV